MRVLHILKHVKNSGNGIVNVCVDLACLQAGRGHEVVVASAGGDYEELLSKHGVRHFSLRQSRHPLDLLKASWNYRKLISEFSPEIVHAHMITSIILARLLKFSSSYTLVSSIHNEFQRSSILMGVADKVIAVSHEVRNSFIKKGISPQKISVIHNGPLDSPRKTLLSSKPPHPLKGCVITSVAGLHKHKGLNDLIEAFSLIASDFPNAHLYLVGDGPERDSLRHQAQQSSCYSRIHFEGFQPEPQRYLHSTDIFVLASHSETFGLALAEAREAGCSLIGTNVGGIPEVLEHGEAGLLVPPSDAVALSKALRKLLSCEVERGNWSHKASLNIQWLTAHRMTEESICLYEKNTDSMMMKSASKVSFLGKY